MAGFLAVPPLLLHRSREPRGNTGTRMSSFFRLVNATRESRPPGGFDVTKLGRKSIYSGSMGVKSKRQSVPKSFVKGPHRYIENFSGYTIS